MSYDTYCEIRGIARRTVQRENFILKSYSYEFSSYGGRSRIRKFLLEY